MEENTDAQSNASITDDSAVDNIAEELLAQDGQADSEVEQGEQVEQQQEAVEPAVQPTRSERREQNYIDKLSEQIRNSHPSANRSNDELGQRQEYQPLKYEDGDYAIDQLESDREAYGKYQREQGIREAQSRVDPIKQQLWAQQLEFDNERVQKTWDILDESNEKTFDPDFAHEMTQKYLNFIGYRETKDPQTGRVLSVSMDRDNVRWIDFVKAEKQNLDRYVERAQATSTRNIVKQAANTGIRPSGQARTSTRPNIDTSDPYWISKYDWKPGEWDKWGRQLADEQINSRLGIK